MRPNTCCCQHTTLVGACGTANPQGNIQNPAACPPREWCCCLGRSLWETLRGGVPAFDKWCPSWPPTQPALHLCRPPPPAARSLHIYACLPSHIYMCVFRPIQFLCFGMLASPLVCPPIVIDVALCGRMTGSRARRPCTGGTESTSQSTSGIRAYLHATTWKG